MVNLLKENSMKANPKKFQFMIFGKTSRQPITLNINQIKVKESQKVLLLGLTIDNQVTFKDHVDMLCSTANYKLHALRRRISNSGKSKVAIQCIYKQPI